VTAGTNPEVANAMTHLITTASAFARRGSKRVVEEEAPNPLAQKWRKTLGPSSGSGEAADEGSTSTPAEEDPNLTVASKLMSGTHEDIMSVAQSDIAARWKAKFARRKQQSA
jgi:hypothetical protein